MMYETAALVLEYQRQFGRAPSGECQRPDHRGLHQAQWSCVRWEIPGWFAGPLWRRIAQARSTA